MTKAYKVQTTYKRARDGTSDGESSSVSDLCTLYSDVRQKRTSQGKRTKSDGFGCGPYCGLDDLEQTSIISSEKGADAEHGRRSAHIAVQTFGLK
jgi:hypothetical protein